MHVTTQNHDSDWDSSVAEDTPRASATPRGSLKYLTHQARIQEEVSKIHIYLT